MIYNLYGDFLRKIGIKSYPHSIAKFNNEFLLFLNRSSPQLESNESFDLTLIDENGGIKESFFPNTVDYANWNIPNISFYEFNGRVNYFDYWRNQVYVWNEDEFIPYLKINYGNMALPYEYTKTSKDYDEMKRNFRHTFHTFLESDNFVYFDLYDKGELAAVFYDKQNNELNILNRDRNNQENILINPIASLSGNRFVSIIKPDILKVLNEHNLLNKSVLIELADTIDKYDNPALLIFTVKFGD